MITAVFEHNHRTYGYRRVHAVLARSGVECSPELVRKLMRAAGLVTVVTPHATAYLPLRELVDIAAELERIRKEIEKAQNGLRSVEQKLSNEKFVSRAPEAVVNAEREKAAKYQELIAKLEESAKAMQA